MKLYLDTSVFGAYYDKEFEEDTTTLIEYIIQEDIEVVISNILEEELEKAPKRVRLILSRLRNISNVKLDIDASKLAQLYIEEGALGKKSLNDARHIAIATIQKVDVVVSWNFKHMVHFMKVEQYNDINLRQGYKSITIYSPTDLVRSLEISPDN